MGLAVLAVLVVYFYRPLQPAKIGPSTVPAAEKPAAAAKQKRQASAVKKHESSRTRAVEPGEVSASLPPSSLLVTPASTVLVPLPFPNPADLRAGMDRSEIRRIYGDPTLKLTTMIGGSLVERYIYVNRDRSNATVADLRNGRTISASRMIQ
ncbi:MAG: hypothetical protein HYZ57_05160 [Acidobacteria bacterium]|nr:hypothetical protein [Acidobacteriota bacterium]